MKYLGEEIFFSDKVKICFVSALKPSNVYSATILRFIDRICDHIDKRFPEDELENWIAFDPDAILNASRFNFGNCNVTTLIEKYADPVIYNFVL